MNSERTQNIPKSKLKSVQELVDLIKNKKTILIASIKNIPASQYQEISKKLRKNVIVKVPKKNLVLRALDNSENKEVKKIKDQIEDSVALLFSDLDSYELAGELLRNTSPAKAKSGQEAPEDIIIHEGPTDLIPGPAVSELSALGIRIKIEKGKINIQKSKTIVKKGEKISQAAADLMSKLDIKPFDIGFIPVSAFDTKENKLYLEIKIDPKGTLELLKSNYGKSLALAVEVGYANKDTITFLIGKAGAYKNALGKLLVFDKGEKPNSKEDSNKENKGEETEEVSEEVPKEEEKEEDTQQNKSEGNK